MTNCLLEVLQQHESSYFEIVVQAWHHRFPPQHSLRVKLSCRFHSAVWWIETVCWHLLAIHRCCSHANRTSPQNLLMPLEKTIWTPCRHDRRNHIVIVTNTFTKKNDTQWAMTTVHGSFIVQLQINGMVGNISVLCKTNVHKYTNSVEQPTSKSESDWSSSLPCWLPPVAFSNWSEDELELLLVLLFGLEERFRLVGEEVAIPKPNGEWLNGYLCV